jgi:hypothetical protein
VHIRADGRAPLAAIASSLTLRSGGGCGGQRRRSGGFERACPPGLESCFGTSPSGLETLGKLRVRIFLEFAQQRSMEGVMLLKLLSVPASMRVTVRGIPFDGCKQPQLAPDRLEQIKTFVEAAARMGGTYVDVELRGDDLDFRTDAKASTAAESKEFRLSLAGLGVGSRMHETRANGEYHEYMKLKEDGIKYHLTRCTGCGETVKCKLCTRCRAPFCSEDCIRASWKTHKASCKASAAASKVCACVFFSVAAACGFALCALHDSARTPGPLCRE